MLSARCLHCNNVLLDLGVCGVCGVCDVWGACVGRVWGVACRLWVVGCWLTALSLPPLPHFRETWVPGFLHRRGVGRGVANFVWGRRGGSVKLFCVFCVCLSFLCVHFLCFFFCVFVGARGGSGRRKGRRVEEPKSSRFFRHKFRSFFSVWRSPCRLWLTQRAFRLPWDIV